MSRYKPGHIIAIHLVALAGSLGLVYISGQNPRIILYGLSFGLLFRFISVWFLSNRALNPDNSAIFVDSFSRPPEAGEKSRPYRDQKTRERAGLSTYIIGVLTMMFMIGILQILGSGTGFLKMQVLIPEISWGLLISVAYWIEDLVSRNVIIAAGESTPVNLGYNVSGFNFLLAALFISNVLLLLPIPFTMVFSDLFTSETGFWRKEITIDWIVLCVLMLIRFAYDIRLPEKNIAKNELTRKTV